MSDWNKLGKKIILWLIMRNKVVVMLAIPSSFWRWRILSDFYVLICGHLFFQTLSIRETFKWATFTLLLNGAHKCLAHCKMFQAWLASQCLKRELEMGHWMLIILLHPLTALTFLGWTCLSLTLMLHHFLILLSSCCIEFHVLSPENQGKWQTCCRFLFLSGILTDYL